MDSLVLKLFEKLENRHWKLATAESCTAGMIAAAVTAVPGSSAYFDRGFITYSNNAKTEMLTVPAHQIDALGAVSAEVAESMAKGALEASKADITVAVTGIAGPNGGTAEKPVGLVFIAVATWETLMVHEHRFCGDRATIRVQAASAAIEHLIRALD